MTRALVPLHSLNAGQVSPLALGRVDLAKMRMAAELQENLLPKVMGPAIFRPGTAYKTESYTNADATLIPFVFSASTKALLEMTNFRMRVLLDGVPLSRVSVSAAVTNGTFASDLTGWTDADEGGATSSWDAGFLSLAGTGANFAIRTQEVTVTDVGVEHALRVVVARGKVHFRVGSLVGEDNYVAETVLREGDHSIAFTPIGNFFIWIAATTEYPSLVDSVTVEASGDVLLTTPWPGADLPYIRHDQSGDVLFCANDGIQQRRIERRSQRSWSVAKYDPEDGPFRLPNTSQTTISNSSISGFITLTSTRPIFRAGHAGALWRLTHSGQAASATLSGADQYTSPIRVTGLAVSRQFVIGISGTFSGTITLQRAYGEPSGWEDATDDLGAVQSWTAPVVTSYGEALDNQIIYYRLGFKSGAYVSGSAVATLTYASGVQSGIVRITSVFSSTIAYATVLKTLGKIGATTDWEEGAWSGHRGYPSSVAFHDGRLWWGWRDGVYGSVSDAYESFDDEVEGDAGPIIRSVATGGYEGIHWLLSLQRLMAGTASQEVSIRSSSFDEPLTPTQFTARRCSTRGSGNVPAVEVDSTGIFAQRDLKRIFELAYSVEANDYSSRDLTRLFPEACDAGVRCMAVQRQPETRIWLVLNDGTCAVLTYERDDEVVAWTPVTTHGQFKWVATLPGDDEDQVWFVVSRTANGSARNMIEVLAKESECVGNALSKNLDSHVVYSGSSTSTLTGLTHLEGQQVVVWAGGAPLVTTPLTVSSGSVTLPSAVTSAVVGRVYTGRFKSAKLAYAAQGGTALLQKKRVDHVGLLMAHVAWKGVRVGSDFTTMTGLHGVYLGKQLTAGQVLTDYDYDASSLAGKWSTDARVCFQIASPYCGTFMGLVVRMKTNDRASADQAGNGG